MAEPRIDQRIQSSRRATALRHPTPDLQTLQGAYIRNIDKLERSAEEISNSGSDLGEEIRRLSRQSSHSGEVHRRGSILERVGSARSNRSNSYGHGVNANHKGRRSGYSPSGIGPSPVGSVSSWSRASVSRVQSGSWSSRLDPMQEGKSMESPLRASFGIDEEERRQIVEEPNTYPDIPSRHGSQSSFAQRYDEIAGQIETSLEHVPPSPSKDEAVAHHEQALQHLEVGASDVPDRPRSTDTYQEAQIAFKDFDGVHFSPDTDEFVELDEHGNEVRRISARNSSGGYNEAAATLLRTAHDRPISQAPPPPDENMVYYPAPVPRMLNLPKRLSQLPAANVQAKRRSHVLGSVPSNIRASAPWLQEEVIGEDGIPVTNRQRSSGSGSSAALPRAFLNERMSTNMDDLPPQLRASMFFEHQPVQHDIEVKSESAVATLDSILNASATAPVHAFTDHPYMGDVRSSVYSPEKIAKRKSTLTLASQASPEQKRPKNRRSSSIGALLRRVTSKDEISQTLSKRDSRASMLTDFNDGSSKLRKRQSQLSMGAPLDGDETTARTPGSEIMEPDLQSGLVAAAQNAESSGDDRRRSRAPTVMSSGYKLDEHEQDDDEELEDEEEDEHVEGDGLFVQPSTLLAELQVRKAQLKSRNKTAATAFPNGMHSTLLQLDAVEEISKRKRQHQRIALAWEDPHQRQMEEDDDDADEDVPLGMLFPGRQGETARKVGDGRDFERPIGLMEKRELEDSEPLSSRRNRLRGRSPNAGRMVNASQLDLAAEAGAEEEDEEDGDGQGETLADRIRRMKTKNALDSAISDIPGAREDGERPKSGLVEDVMSQFGGLGIDESGDAEVAEKSAGASPQVPPPEEEETLGQRRARLQREREASGGHQRNVSGGSAGRSGLRSATSLANLLSAHPVGQRTSGKAHEPAQGSLLHASAQQQAKQRDQLQSTNMNASNRALERSLVDHRQQKVYEPQMGGLLSQQHSSRAPVGGFAAGAFNNGAGGVQTQPVTSPSMPVYQPAMNGYFASPTAMAGYGYAASPVTPYGHPVYAQQMPMQMPMHSPMMMNSGYQQMGMNSYMPQTMSGGTYASFAQNGSLGPVGTGYGAGMGMGLGEEPIEPNQRAAIDRWRLSVAQ